MTPTREQIEAAAKAAFEFGNDYRYPWDMDAETQERFRGIATAALTAAAQVGLVNEILQADKEPPEGYISRIEELTAAQAETGEHELTKDRAEIRAATIERCAQLIENDSFTHPDKRRLAAAIRALKE